MEIVHLAFASEWEAAKLAGTYSRSTRGASLDDVGFIHCSLPEQVGRVAAFVYADVEDALVLLTLDSEQVEAGGTPVVFEDGGDGEHFPHLYGPIDPAWVKTTTPARMADGQLTLG